MSSFLSTPSARRATQRAEQEHYPLHISIHALCEEGDRTIVSPSSRSTYFYPRPLRGGRQLYPGQPRQPDRFLSTPSARRATRAGHIAAHFGNISIHALCEEGDWVAWTSDIDDYKFLSTPSARRATVTLRASSSQSSISIHALCEEGDCCRGFPEVTY